MRRGIMLLIFGWCACWTVFILQFIQECNADACVGVATMSTGSTITQISFPYAIAGTNLLVEGIGIYEGPFLEDGSNRPTCNTAALMVKNISASSIERCGIILEIAGEVYAFEAYGIPPAQRVYIIEAEMKQYKTEPITICAGWSVEEDLTEMAQTLNIEECSGEYLKVTNITNQTLPAFRLLYKSFDCESGIYIGGVCQEIEVGELAAGQSVMIQPYRYVHGYSKVVGIMQLD